MEIELMSDAELSPEHLTALSKTRKALAEGTLPAWVIFDMGRWANLSYETYGPCRMCIGGVMSLHLTGAVPAELPDVSSKFTRINGSISIDLVKSPVLYPLFFHRRFDYDESADEAVAAIDRFLAGERTNPWQIGVEALEKAREMWRVPAAPPESS